MAKNPALLYNIHYDIFIPIYCGWITFFQVMKWWFICGYSLYKLPCAIHVTNMAWGKRYKNLAVSFWITLTELIFNESVIILVASLVNTLEIWPYLYKQCFKHSSVINFSKYFHVIDVFGFTDTTIASPFRWNLDSVITVLCFQNPW